MLGYEGRKAERLRRRLRGKDFTSATSMAFGGLMSMLFVAGEYRLRPLIGDRMRFEGDPDLLMITSVFIVCCLIYKPFTNLAMTS